MKKYIPVAIIVPLFIGLASFAIASQQEQKPYVKPVVTTQSDTAPQAAPVQSTNSVKTTQPSTNVTPVKVDLPHAPVIDYSVINEPTVTAPVVNYPVTPPKQPNCRPIVYGSSSYICD